MLFKTAGQASVFLAMVYSGLAIGLAYDAAALLRAVFGRRRLSSAVFDAAFCLFALGVFVACSLLANKGSFHMFMLLGCLCGFLLYRITLSRVARLIAHKVSALCKVAWRSLKNTVLGKKLTK